MTTESASPNGYGFEELKVGMSATFSRTISEADLVNFADLTGDTNPLHLDEEYAARTPFGGRIAHGMLTASLISAVIGTKLPGPGCVYVSQTLKFMAPVKIGDTVSAVVSVRELINERKRVVLTTRCFVDGKVVIDGEALVALPGKRAA